MPKDTGVGYGKPPTHSRFKKGQSGNPHGRPKGTLNLATVLERTLRERVIINENGKRTTVTKLEAAMKQLVNKAASGELVALKQLLALVNSADSRAMDADEDPTTVGEGDMRIVQNIMKRFQKSIKDGDHK